MRSWLILIILVTVQTHAEVYKWTDDKGQVHYGDKPIAVPEAEAFGVDTRKNSGVALDDKTRVEKRQRLLDAMAEDRKEKVKQREKARAENADRQRRCVYYKDRLRLSQQASGVYRLDQDGNRVFLSEAGREQSSRNLQAQINKYCR